MLAIMVLHAYSPSHLLWLGASHPPFRRKFCNCLQICRKTVSPLMYSGLLVSTLTPRCLSWSGYMEADSYVRGECYYPSINSRRFTAGASFLYDGTPLVEQSVNRVRAPSRTHKSSMLIEVMHRGHRSCTCLSTIVLDLSASLKDLRQ